MPETKPPTITSNALPPTQRPSAVVASPAQPVEVVPESQIVAKPLRAPNFINILPKNPNLCGRWVNRAVGEKESGLRYDQCVAMGFVPAKPQDVYLLGPMGKTECPENLSKDGRILYGDVIYMVIPRVDYIGATKWNEESAMGRVRRLGQSQTGGQDTIDSTEGRRQPSSALSELTRSKAGQAGKVTPYIPKLAETDAKTADNTGGFNLADK